MGDSPLDLSKLFQPAADVINNLIDKCYDAIGYMAIPKGKREDKERAVKYFIAKIEEDENIPTLMKAAAISNARKIIRQYSNQIDIVNMAITELNSKEKINIPEDDWLEYFFDRAKNISKEDMQHIFAKVLARECENTGSISKQLINILEMIDAYTADAFKRICKYRVNVKNENGKVSNELLIVDSVRLKEHHINLEYNELDELNNIGLINFTVIGSYEIANAIVSEISYGEVIYKISNRERKNFPTGMVKLTRVGEELVECLVGEFEEEFEMEIENYLDENGYKFEKIKNDG